MAIKKVNNTYWLDVTVKGKRHRKSLKTTDKPKAQEVHDKFKAQLWDKEYLGREPEHTWEEATNKWLSTHQSKLSIDRDRIIISYYSRYFAKRVLANCDFNEALESLNVGEATKNRYKAFARSLLREAKFRWGWKISLPSFKFMPETPREFIPSDEAFKKLLAELPDKVRNTVVFAVETGLRKANILGIRYHQVDFDHRTVTISGSDMKAGKSVTLPLSASAVEILKSNSSRMRFSSNDYLLFKAAAKRAGIPELRFHDLRHMFASRLGKKGVPLEIISRLLSHSSLKMTERYRHYCIEELKNYV